MKAPTETQIIYIKLLKEGVDVWRPVQAINEGENIFTILPNTKIYNPKDEEWQFNPGQTVKVRQEQHSDGIVWAAYILHPSS
jgi:hypothetical protein